MMPKDVESPIDLRRMTDASDWARQAEDRPGRAEILTAFVDTIVGLKNQELQVLELGSGPGFLAKRILERLPRVRYTALDFSPAMHALATARLTPFLGRITFLERSFKESDWTRNLPLFDVVVTNQAVHELRHKRHAEALHRQVRSLLTPEGCYLVSDHFSDPGGLPNKELFMTRDEQRAVLQRAGFAPVDRLLSKGTLVLHRAGQPARTRGSDQV